MSRFKSSCFEQNKTTIDGFALQGKAHVTNQNLEYYMAITHDGQDNF